jgi:hypothetical protein
VVHRGTSLVDWSFCRNLTAQLKHLDLNVKGQQVQVLTDKCKDLLKVRFVPCMIYIDIVLWWYHLLFHICADLSKTENGHNSIHINLKVRICRLLEYVEGYRSCIGCRWLNCSLVCLCLQVYRQGGIQRYVNWYWYVMQIPFTILLPYLFKTSSGYGLFFSTSCLTDVPKVNCLLLRPRRKDMHIGTVG